MVRVYGQDLDVLRRRSERRADIVGGVGGVLDPSVERVPEEPVLAVRDGPR